VKPVTALFLAVSVVGGYVLAFISGAHWERKQLDLASCGEAAICVTADGVEFNHNWLIRDIYVDYHNKEVGPNCDEGERNDEQQSASYIRWQTAQ
jgi:hypothetical protein